MTRGGKREGSGRPAMEPESKSKMASYRLPPSVAAAIKAKAARLGISQAALITAAVEAFQAEPQ